MTYDKLDRQFFMEFLLPCYGFGAILHFLAIIPMFNQLFYSVHGGCASLLSILNPPIILIMLLYHLSKQSSFRGIRLIVFSLLIYAVLSFLIALALSRGDANRAGHTWLMLNAGSVVWGRTYPIV